MSDHTSTFPADDYTPYGYLNLPGHARRLNPKGVMRSSGIGFRWHFPALATSYGGRRERYTAGLQVTGSNPIDARMPYHSSSLKVFELDAWRLSWFMVDDDCLAVAIEGAPGTSLDLTAHYERVVAADGDWGESGLVGRMDGSDVILQSFEDGDALVVRSIDANLVPDLSDTVCSVAATGEVATLTIDITVRPQSARAFVLMGRGPTADAARDRVDGASPSAVLAERIAADDAFWSAAPRLTGDWPAHWRRGLVYDLETLRMMVKEPIGRYAHRWDAMQIQAPRTVLGEAAMDALCLAWADPRLAAGLLLGTLLDAPLPNVPCSREDGTYNMVASDGTVCGTGPEWGYPFLVAERIAAALDDPDWVRAIYPPLAAYHTWWQRHRTDSDGWWVHACSWESGQDLSPRFGDQPRGGGHPTRHLRPVDLQAAAAHSAGVLARFATIAAPEDAKHWYDLASVLTDRVQVMWVGDRFADVDNRDNKPTDIHDVMHLAPAALGIVDPNAVAALRATLTTINSDDLVWPMFVWTPVLAAHHLQDPDRAADLAAAVVDRAYRFWDARPYDGRANMPGIASEYWPLTGRCGGEGYGWGAFTTELLLGSLVGVDVTADALTLRPCLPRKLHTPGARYGVEITIRGHHLQILLEPRGDGVLRLSVADHIWQLDPAGQIRIGWDEL